MPVPDHRIAICRRCRQPERRAKGATEAAELLADAKQSVADSDLDVHFRLSQCLNCCDGGHTVRVECRGVEVALVGMRTSAELRTKVLDNIERIAVRDIPAELQKRVWQIWVDGEMVWHRSLEDDADTP
ncbi:MAG: putative metal-binding protein [Bradymonadia bacterium]|jgi:predicted metal-binding protein